MGAATNKDKDAQVYLTIDKRMYHAGDTVHGSVYLVCLKERPYRYLNLRIMGEEKVEWVRYYGNNHYQVYQNQKDTYCT